MTHRNRFLLCVSLLALLCLPAAADLLEYVARPEPEFQWSKVSEQTVGTATVIDLAMTSQMWQGIPWKHTIRIIVPAGLQYTNAALLVITGGNPGRVDEQYAQVASMLRAPVAILYNIPNQPLFGGLNEDALIAYTFVKYMETGDATWPLLLPMTKSAVKAMDALQAFARQNYGVEVATFVVTGASKRGWTTWLTAAVDQKRVKGIAPMVIDNLNIPAQMPHQLATWGRYSEQIADYTRLGLQAQVGSAAGTALVTMVDPYNYRERITMPKLIINGANDRYWVTDALNFYWDDLVGPKHVLYVPNSGHGLEDKERVFNAMAAFFHSVASGTAFPAMSWRHGDAEGKLTLSITATPKPTAARIWAVRSDDRDFRDDRWEATPMIAEDDTSAFVGSLPKPASGNIALFGEAEFGAGGRTFTLSTQVRVAPDK